VASQEPQEAPIDLGPWLDDLRTRAGLSVRALAQTMGTDRGNVKDWLDGKGGMTAKTLLLFLNAVGAKIEPAAPENAPRAMNSELAEVRSRLEALEETVSELPTAEDLKRGLDSLRRSIARASRDSREAQPASKRASR
jgi:transcriptional regulator with XRE-family HTH domain